MIVFAHSGLNDADPEGAADGLAGAAEELAGAADDEVPDDEVPDDDPPPHAASTATNGTMARARQEILMRRA